MALKHLSELSGRKRVQYCDTPYRATPFQRFSERLALPQIGATAPSWYLVLHRHIWVIPNFAAYRAIIVQYAPPLHNKQAQKSFATLSLQALRDIKSIAVGPLSFRVPSGSRLDLHPQRLLIFHLILGGRNESLLRKPVSLTRGVKVLESAVGAAFAPTRFSLVRMSVRDLVPERNSY